jgi:hypothetical protein
MTAGVTERPVVTFFPRFTLMAKTPVNLPPVSNRMIIEKHLKSKSPDNTPLKNELSLIKINTLSLFLNSIFDSGKYLLQITIL